MADLTFTPGDAEWTKLRKRALSDLYWFAGVVCKMGDLLTMTDAVHGMLCRVASRRTGVPEIDTCPYQLLLLPRGMGKSVLITQIRTLQMICADPNVAFLIANERLDNATAFLGAIKHHIEQNDFLRALFPEIIPPDFNKTTWSETEIVVNRTTGRVEPTVLCIGAGGTVTGMHPDHIIADDILSREAMQNARRGDGNLTTQLNGWCNQLIPLLNTGALPFPTITVVGTRWFRGDTYEQLEQLWGYGQEKRTWSLSIKTSAGQTDPIDVHRVGDLVLFSRKAVEHGKAIWSERPGYDVESLSKMRLRDPELYAANYQNDPSDDITATFKEAWLQFYDWGNEQVSFLKGDKQETHLLTDLDRIMIIDPGGFAHAKGNDRMRGAILVTGSTMTDSPDHLILDTYSDQVPFTQVAEQILAMATRYAPRKVYIEEQAQQAAFLELVRRLATERGVSLPLERITTKNKVKEARILNLEPYFQRGLIRFGKGPQFHELREQYRAFPRGSRVDLLDALAYGPTVWRQPKMSAQSQTRRQQGDIERYRAQRGWRVPGR